MTEATHAETLGITEGSIVGVIADSVEETALLDPLPAGAETVDEPIDGMDAALLLADNLASLEVQLDEVLPSLGSTPGPASTRTGCFPRESQSESVSAWPWAAISR